MFALDSSQPSRAQVAAIETRKIKPKFANFMTSD
jgi:hypothetical protein